MLNMYQLWLDDLYPRAKFKDALAITEKLGHSKKMQMMRRTWIDESKPQPREPSPEVEDVDMTGLGAGVRGEARRAGDGEEGLFAAMSPTARENVEQAPRQDKGDAPDDDELDALLAEGGMEEGGDQPPVPQIKQRGPFEEDDDPDEDELDALMAEDGMAADKGVVARSIQPASTSNQDFDDEEEAMMSMGGMW